MSATPIIRRSVVALVAVILAAVNAGCSTSGCASPLCSFGGGGGGGTAPPPVFSLTTIPANDTEPVNAGGTQWDITTVGTARTGVTGGGYNQIVVNVTFAQPTAFTALPAPGSVPTGGGALGVVIFFDTDANVTTGLTPNVCGNAYKGIEFAVSDGSITGRLSNGNYPIFNISTLTKSGEATVSGGGNTVSYSIPLAAIGGNTSGLMGVAATNFIGGENAVDCAPDGGTVST